MGRKGFEVTIEPSVLIWARKTAGYDAEEAAGALGFRRDEISRWELGEGKPTLSKLEKLANKYKRPLAVFFLPRPPEEKPFPKDFRSFPESKKPPFSSQTRFAIRRASRLQSLAKELMESLDYRPVLQIGTVNRACPESEAIRIRGILGVNIQEQVTWKNEREALRTWTDKLQKFGIFVFQLEIPEEEKIRGFSLTENAPPTIVLNVKDAINGKIFSLLHEYAHLLVNDGGICDMEELHLKPKDISTEQFCNHLAGAILVPKDDLLNHELVKRAQIAFKWPDETLQIMAKDFKVSKEVILRRLTLLKRASQKFYKIKHDEWKDELRRKKELEKEKRKEKEISFARDMPHECIKENGLPFVSLVLEAYAQDKITYIDVADYLRIRLKHFPKVEQLLRKPTLI